MRIFRLTVEQEKNWYVCPYVSDLVSSNPCHAYHLMKIFDINPLRCSTYVLGKL